MTFIPSFRNMRIFSFIALLGTTFTAWYLVAHSAPHGYQKGLWGIPGNQNLQNFVLGGTNLLFVYGGHAMLVYALLLTNCLLLAVIPFLAQVKPCKHASWLSTSAKFRVLPRVPRRQLLQPASPCAWCHMLKTEILFTLLDLNPNKL